MQKNKINKNMSKAGKSMALSQIFLLVISTIAFAYVLGSEIGVVSGEGRTLASLPVEGTKTCVDQLENDIWHYGKFTKGSCVAGVALPPSVCTSRISRYPGTYSTSNCPDTEALDGSKEETSVSAPGDSTASACGTACTATQTCVNGECLNQCTGAENAVDGACGESKIFQEDQICKSTKVKDEKTGRETSTNKCGFSDDNAGLIAWMFGGASAAALLATQVLPEKDKDIGYLATGSLALGLFAGEGAAKYAGFGLGESALVGAGVAGLAFLALFQTAKQKSIVYAGHVWQPPRGGSNCEKCGQQGILPCSEYQCRSLGQACELVNPGTEEETCVWVNQDDAVPPVLRPLDEALLSNYRYIYNEAEVISPPDRGVEIQIFNTDSTEGCIPAFTPFTFGLNSSEPAQCKTDFVRKPTFDEMSYYMGGSTLFKKEHIQQMSLAQISEEALAELPEDVKNSEAMEILTGGEYAIAVRCQDKNGNWNPGEFIFKFCIDKSPDTTPPLIVDTDPSSGMPFSSNITEMPINVYTNEWAECKWSHEDKSYDNMENDLSCRDNEIEFNAQMLFMCTGIVDGLESDKDNHVYIRCLDNPSAASRDERIANQESYDLVLKGTRPLQITSIGPNETIKENTARVPVTLTATTFAGFNDGISLCSYSLNMNGPYTDFIESAPSATHSTQIFLPAGSYTYYVRCIDIGGNAVTAPTSFIIESDYVEPLIARVYHEGTNLKIVTNEEAECVYSEDDCVYLFEDGNTIRDINGLEHYLGWETDKTYYIKCKDIYGNRPTLGTECSVIARPFGSFII